MAEADWERRLELLRNVGEAEESVALLTAALQPFARRLRARARLIGGGWAARALMAARAGVTVDPVSWIEMRRAR